MTPAEVIRRASLDGVSLSVSPGGNVKASGNKEALARWLPLIRESKAGVVDLLAELTALVRLCGEHYSFTEAEHAEALQCALADPAAALTCFLALAGEIAAEWPPTLMRGEVES